jgi:hypothetical protein
MSVTDPLDPEQALRNLQSFHTLVEQKREELQRVGELTWGSYVMREIEPDREKSTTT